MKPSKPLVFLVLLLVVVTLPITKVISQPVTFTSASLSNSNNLNSTSIITSSTASSVANLVQSSSSGVSITTNRGTSSSTNISASQLVNNSRTVSQTTTSSTIASITNHSFSTTTLPTLTAVTSSNSTSSRIIPHTSAGNSTTTITSASTASHQTNSTSSIIRFFTTNSKTNSSSTLLAPTNFTTQTNSTSAQTTLRTTSTTLPRKLNLPSELVTVDSSPSSTNLAVTVDGAMISTPRTFNWTVGSIHLLSANSSITCSSGCQWAFRNWSDGGSQNHSIIVPNATASYIATFHLQYYLTTITSPSNGGSVTPASGWVNSGNAVTLQANSATGYQFSSWSCSGVGCYNGTAQSPTLSINGPVLEVAGFQPTTSGYSVTFQEYGLPPSVVWSIYVNGNYYTTGSASITVTGLSGTVNYAYQGLVFGNYLYNQYYYLNCYIHNLYCYNDWNYYNQYFNDYHPSVNYPYYLSEYVCVYACQGTVSGNTRTTSNYLFYQTINQNQNLSPQAVYSTTFQVNGLPSGTTWSISVSGNYYSTSDSSITLYGLTGTINYAYQNPISNFYCQSNCSGSVSNSGTTMADYQTQSYVIYTVTSDTVPVPEFSRLNAATMILAFLFVIMLVHRKERPE